MHYKQQQLEDQLRALCDDLDEYLEDTYGNEFSLRPNRPKRGTAASNQYDGLFATSSAFTLGYGSAYGRGYVVTLTLCTFDWIDEARRKEIMDDAFQYVSAILPHYFPDRKLSIVHDGNVMKIVGDFSLGDV